MLKNSWIANAYSGDAKLWKVFWFGYIGTLLPVTILSNIAKEIAKKNPASIFANEIYVVSWVLYAWLAISLWRCSKNSSHKGFILLGRFWAVVLGIFLLSGLLLMFQIAKA
jgi:hypothetical protein